MGFGLLACIVPLYWAKTEADKMRDHMHQLQVDVAKERREVQVLEAQLTYLSRYDRIEKVASEKLGLSPITGAQIADLSDLDKIAPIGPVSAPVVSAPTPSAAVIAPPAEKGGVQ